MGYQSQVERDRPAYFNTFDNATNKSHALVEGFGQSALISTTAFTHQFNGWDQPFTVEFWVKPLASNVRFIGHDNDGIIYDGTNVIFTVIQKDNTVVTATVPATTEVMYVVGQYTGYSIDLFVNGVQGSAPVTGSIQYTGTLKSTGKMSIDALAIYPYILNDDQMYDHFTLGRAFPVTRDALRGESNYFALSNDQENIMTRLTFPDWQGFFDGTTLSADILVNDIGVNNGQFTTGVLLPDDVPVYGSKVKWSFTGTPPVVESSLDDLNWSAVSNNGVINGVPSGETLAYDPSIRITLGADTRVLSLEVIVYAGADSIGTKSDRVINFTRPAVSGDELVPYLQNDNAGAYINGGSVSISSGDSTVGAVSFWYKGTEVAGGTKNGGLGHLADQWNFIVKTGTTLVTNYTGQISAVSTWGTLPDSTSLYQKQFVRQTLSVPVGDTITVYEPANGVKLYQSNWIVI